MQTTHTPGPWHIAAAQDRTYPHAIESRDSSFDGFQLARCVNPADARVIAAAPAMLATLSGLLGALEADAMDDKSNVYRSLMIEARAAIAAATGEQ